MRGTLKQFMRDTFKQSVTPDKHGQTLNVTVKLSLADTQGHSESPRKLHKGNGLGG